MDPQLLNSKWMGALATAILLISAPLHAEIYKWTDANGNVHFSDKVPVQQRSKAASVEVTANAPSEEDVRAASERAAKIHNAAQVTAEGNRSRSYKPKSHRATNYTGGIMISPGSQGAASEKSPGSYDEAMKRYKQSQMCFGLYKNENGSNRAGASQNCANVSRPRESDY